MQNLFFWGFEFLQQNKYSSKTHHQHLHYTTESVKMLVKISNMRHQLSWIERQSTELKVERSNRPWRTKISAKLADFFMSRGSRKSTQKTYKKTHFLPYKHPKMRIKCEFDTKRCEKSLNLSYISVLYRSLYVCNKNAWQ